MCPWRSPLWCYDSRFTTPGWYDGCRAIAHGAVAGAHVSLRLLCTAQEVFTVGACVAPASVPMLTSLMREYGTEDSNLGRGVVLSAAVAAVCRRCSRSLPSSPPSLRMSLAPAW